MLSGGTVILTAVGGGSGVHPSGTCRIQGVFSAFVRGFFASSSSSQHSLTRTVDGPALGFAFLVFSKRVRVEPLIADGELGERPEWMGKKTDGAPW